ncbi:uncharacterized protein [Typha latifolia]|uniref:uncharacterized protein isoform X1 n=1 Tax=Typha latifolia TaxID=4733 RepID=UPI003C2BBF8B
MLLTSRALSSLLLPSSSISKLPPFLLRLPLRPFSTTATPYPLYYELVHHRPVRPPRPPPSPSSKDDQALPSSSDGPPPDEEPIDRSKRRYYRKRRQRMLGSDDPDSSSASADAEFVELKPEVVEFPRLHAREEELYFYDAFALPWEKEKHYRMVYQLEKKYFPEHSLDKAFVDPAAAEPEVVQREGKRKATKKKKEEDDRVGGGGERDEKALVFFDEGATERKKERPLGDVTERKVEEFFKCLKKVPCAGEREVVASAVEVVEPYLATRRSGLPPRWDGPSGTVVLVDKPKGWTSFTVCGKLRRLVKVQKVGHAGTLDPMATGLLIVCVGKATKLVDRYQGMLKGYSGVFRLGEATSTWDADSPVIQREPWEHIKDEDIKKRAASFLGEIWQVPPMFSAIKVGGEKMYEKARRGEMIELSPRRISIYQFDIERSLEDRQNLIFRVTCSKGTYIRSLCADFGKALGSCAHLTALRRDSIGEFLVNDAWNFEELQEEITKGYM